MAVEWTPDLATGTTEIDHQHRELFKQIDSLMSAWKNGKGKAEAEKIIQFLSDYVAFHFGTEEQYMDKFKYSSARNHKSQHAVFVKAFGRLKERYFQAGVNDALIADTNELIVDWFVNHIKYSDKALGLFLKMKV
jgi:hemerythrin